MNNSINKLKATLNKYVDTASHNEEKLLRFQNKEFKFIKLESLSSLIDEATIRYEEDFNATIVTLGLVDPDNELSRILKSEGKVSEDIDRLIIVEDTSAYLEMFKDNRKPIVGKYKHDEYSWLYPNTKYKIRSVVILPLIRRGKILGSLNLGGDKVRRFSSIAATDFLEHMVVVLSICLENILLFSKVTEKTLRDSLTGLWNRRFFDENSKKALDQCLGKTNFSILMIDIDKFKNVNDTYGHDIGDLVLKEVADIAENVLSKHGVLCRFGGEEFVGWLPEMNLSKSFAIADKLRRKIESHLFTGNNEISSLQVTVSVGISTLPSKVQSLDDQLIERMIKNADECLYKAKMSGRNKVLQNEMEK